MATAEQLKERWETDDGKERLAKVIEALKKKQGWPPILNGLPHFEEVEDGRDLRGAPLSTANLRRANLSGADLRRANLSGADLIGADLSGADLSGANLTGAYLSGTVVTGAYLSWADLSGADLSGTVVTGAYLRGANLIGSNLRAADLRGAGLLQACLDNSTLTGAKLYGTSRDDWSIKGVKCDYVFWDLKAEKRSPGPNKEFGPGEFEDLYSSLPEIVYVFEKGINVREMIEMGLALRDLQQNHPEYGLQLASIVALGHRPSMKFNVTEERFKDQALADLASANKRMADLLGPMLEKFFSSMQQNLSQQGINLGGASLINTQLLIGSPGARQDLTITQESQEAVKALCKALSDSLGKPELAAEKAALEMQLKLMEEELAEAQPRSSFLRSCLDVTKGILTSAAGSGLVEALITHVDKVAALF